MAVDTSQFRNGLKIELDGEPFTIVYFQHVKPGKGGAFVRTKVKNLKTGRNLDRRFRSGEKVEEADIEGGVVNDQFGVFDKCQEFVNDLGESWLGFEICPTDTVDGFGALIEAIEKAKPAASKGTYMKSIALSTTMGPGLRIEPTSALALRAS